ncbi:hypothetical protein [Draconibacterium mangrovi]|uniref:hypothetical protein n=1 Tax=Draconibacterium mangrovi TaxID=2697469 RepID=UPI0013D33D78|nr:hypothetical protein [Draconibacterium mangrovi]
MQQGINVFIEDSYSSRHKFVWVTELVGTKMYNLHFDGLQIVRTEIKDELATPKGLGLQPMLSLPETISNIVFKEIAETLSRKGIKPDNQHTLEGELRAKQEHLDDMRMIVKKTLKID